MNSIYASLSILFAEISLILLVICGVLVFLKLRDQRNDKQALTQLTEKLKNAREDRLSVLSIKLKESHHLEGDALAAAAKEIHDKELDFYIATMNIYADRDSGALESLDGKLRELSEAYLKLSSADASSNAAPAEEASAEAGEQAGEEATELKRENTRMQQELETSKNLIQRLEGELDATKQEMRETVAEFVSAFSGGRDAAEEKMSEQMKKKITSTESQKAPAETSEQPVDDGTPPATDVDIDTTEEDELLLPTEETPSPDNSASEAVAGIDVAAEPDEQPTEELSTEESLDDDNPFLSIDDGNRSTGEGSIDRAMDETDLDSDLDIDLEIDLDAPTPETPPAATDSVPDSKGESLEDDLDAGDIDAILAAGANEKAGAEDDIALAEETGGIEDISAEDIDAILEDIDITAAEALSDEKKKAENTA